MGKQKKDKRIAVLDDPTIGAIADGRFRFNTQAQAVQVMDRVFRNFVVSKDQEPVDAGGSPMLKLWVRHFQVTDEEKAKGYKGHFVKLTIQKTDKGKFTLVAEKLLTDLHHHPEKNRSHHRHPDNGHPVLRSAAKGKCYPAIEEARNELLLLHEEFPEISIPGSDKLFIMVYARDCEPPVKKMVLSIAPVPGKGFRLVLADNVKPKKEKPPIVTEAKEVKGKFSSMVALQRKKKKPAAAKKADSKKTKK